MIDAGEGGGVKNFHKTGMCTTLFEHLVSVWIQLSSVACHTDGNGHNNKIQKQLKVKNIKSTAETNVTVYCRHEISVLFEQ